MSKMKQRRDPPPNTVNGQDCGQSQKEVSFVEKSGGLTMKFIDITEHYLQGFLEALPLKYKQELIPWPDDRLYKHPPRYTPDKSAEMDETAKKLFLASNDDYQLIQNWLQLLDREPIEVEANQYCVYSAILKQFAHPKGYTVSKFKLHIAYYIAYYLDFFEPYISPILEKTGQSVYSYIMNIAIGKNWGDRIVVGAISRMFQVKITILSPHYKTPWKVFHPSGLPHIVLIMNGGDWESENPPTHVCATKMTIENYPLVGANYPDMGLIKYEVSRSYGKNQGMTHYAKMVKEKALIEYGKVSVRIEKLNEQLDNVEKVQISLKQQVDYLTEVQNSVKSDLIQLVVTVDELMRYKPKRTVETTVQKREIQKRKETFDWASSVADKPIIDEIYHDGPSNFPKIRRISHPDMIASDTHSEKCTTDDRHPSKADDSVVIRILQSPEPNVPSTSHSNVPKIVISNKCDTLNSGTFQNIDTQGDTVHSDTQDFVFSLDSDQFTTVTMDKEIVTFLEDQFTDDPKKDQFPGTLDVGNIITSVSQEPTVPKDVMSGKSCRGTSEIQRIQQPDSLLSSGVGNQSPKMSTSTEHFSKKKRHQGRGPGMGPVPQNLQDKNRYYCDVCPRNYSTQYDLKVHKRDACGKDPVRIDCPHKHQCGKDFIHEKNLNQHIATHHTGNHLFICPNCGKGISYSRSIDIHKKKCKPESLNRDK